jgi:hypothetical protein
VWLCGEWIAEEQNCGDFSFRNATANHEVSSVRAVSDTFHLQSQFFLQHCSCVACRDQRMGLEELKSLVDKLAQVILQRIMSNQRDHHCLHRLPVLRNGVRNQ